MLYKNYFMCVSLYIDSMTSYIFCGGFLFKFTAFTIKIHD